MSHNQPIVVLITGPAGAGKSTVAQLWASRRPRCAVVDQDVIRHFVKGGFADPVTGWDEERQRQWTLARELTVKLAREYTAAGFDCVIDAPYVPGPAGDRYGDRDWETLLGAIGARGPVVLLPDLAALQTRVQARTGIKKLSPPLVAMIHSLFEAWRDDERAQVIDNSRLTVEQTVEALDVAVNSWGVAPDATA
jgi:predicted kinase